MVGTGSLAYCKSSYLGDEWCDFDVVFDLDSLWVAATEGEVVTGLSDSDWSFDL